MKESKLVSDIWPQVIYKDHRTHTGSEFFTQFRSKSCAWRCSCRNAKNDRCSANCRIFSLKVANCFLHGNKLGRISTSYGINDEDSFSVLIHISLSEVVGPENRTRQKDELERNAV